MRLPFWDKKVGFRDSDVARIFEHKHHCQMGTYGTIKYADSCYYNFRWLGICRRQGTYNVSSKSATVTLILLYEPTSFLALSHPYIYRLTVNCSHHAGRRRHSELQWGMQATDLPTVALSISIFNRVDVRLVYCRPDSSVVRAMLGAPPACRLYPCPYVP